MYIFRYQAVYIQIKDSVYNISSKASYLNSLLCG